MFEHVRVYGCQTSLNFSDRLLLIEILVYTTKLRWFSIFIIKHLKSPGSALNDDHIWWQDWYSTLKDVKFLRINYWVDANCHEGRHNQMLMYSQPHDVVGKLID